MQHLDRNLSAYLWDDCEDTDHSQEHHTVTRKINKQSLRCYYNREKKKKKLTRGFVLLQAMELENRSLIQSHHLHKLPVKGLLCLLRSFLKGVKR